jgi:sodium-dependent phosphate cotransporter
MGEPLEGGIRADPQAGLELLAPKRRGREMLGMLCSLVQRVQWGKVALFLISLFLFVLAIAMMKEGARAFAPLIRQALSLENAANTLGFGWLFAYLIMSGSPVAASALTFFDAGAIDRLGAFTMIAGSRLGASFIVLLLGMIYMLRGRDKASSLSMGLLSLTVTGTTYILGLIIGVILLHAGILNAVQLRSGLFIDSVVGVALDPILDTFLALMPRWALFVLGLGLAMLSFSLFDRCLPKVAVRESRLGRMSRLVYRPWVMFALGALVTLISMSVSVSLSILVPLSNRGFVRRENVIPYIMGANITTFIDTLFAAVLLNNPPAFTIVLVEMVSIMLASLLILIFFYGRYVRMSLGFVEHLTESDRNLLIFTVGILASPIILLLV